MVENIGEHKLVEVAGIRDMQQIEKKEAIVLACYSFSEGEENLLIKSNLFKLVCIGYEGVAHGREMNGCAKLQTPTLNDHQCLLIQGLPLWEYMLVAQCLI